MNGATFGHHVRRRLAGNMRADRHRRGRRVRALGTLAVVALLGAACTSVPTAHDSPSPDTTTTTIAATTTTTPEKCLHGGTFPVCGGPIIPSATTTTTPFNRSHGWAAASHRRHHRPLPPTPDCPERRELRRARVGPLGCAYRQSGLRKIRSKLTPERDLHLKGNLPNTWECGIVQ